MIMMLFTVLNLLAVDLNLIILLMAYMMMMMMMMFCVDFDVEGTWSGGQSCLSSSHVRVLSCSLEKVYRRNYLSWCMHWYSCNLEPHFYFPCNLQPTQIFMF